jgi:hypothetical protein
MTEEQYRGEQNPLTIGKSNGPHDQRIPERPDEAEAQTGEGSADYQL